MSGLCNAYHIVEGKVATGQAMNGDHRHLMHLAMPVCNLHGMYVRSE
jgi:hypothetical protein